MRYASVNRIGVEIIIIAERSVRKVDRNRIAVCVARRQRPIFRGSVIDGVEHHIVVVELETVGFLNEARRFLYPPTVSALQQTLLLARKRALILREGDVEPALGEIGVGQTAQRIGGQRLNHYIESVFCRQTARIPTGDGAGVSVVHDDAAIILKEGVCARGRASVADHFVDDFLDRAEARTRFDRLV